MANWVVGTKCERQWGSGSSVEFKQGPSIAIRVEEIIAIETLPEHGCEVITKVRSFWLFESFEAIMNQLKGA